MQPRIRENNMVNSIQLERKALDRGMEMENWRGNLLVESVEEQSGVGLEFRRDGTGGIVRSIKSSVCCSCIESLGVCGARACPRHRHFLR
jgi:hypothetical protein